MAGALVGAALKPIVILDGGQVYGRGINRKILNCFLNHWMLLFDPTIHGEDGDK